MKRTILALACGVLVLAFGTDGISQKPDNVDVFMHQKLVHSQKVLEGLVTEDFEAIAKHAQAISLLSQAAQWQVLQTPEYARRSTEFRRSTDDLKKAAQKKNLDGATLAFVNVTMKCVECHKYVRSVRNASLDLRDFPRLNTPLVRTVAK